jgi:hypothetical protein
MEPKLSRVYEGAFKRNKIVRNRSESGESEYQALYLCQLS